MAENRAQVISAGRVDRLRAKYNPQSRDNRDAASWEDRRGSWSPSPALHEDVRHGSFERENPPYASRRDSFDGSSPTDVDDFQSRDSSRSYGGGASSVTFASGALAPTTTAPRGVPRTRSKRKSDPDVLGLGAARNELNNAESRERGGSDRGADRGSDRGGAGADILVRGPIHRPARTEQQRAEAAEKRIGGRSRSPIRMSRESSAMRELEQKIGELAAAGPATLVRKAEQAETAPGPPPPSRSQTLQPPVSGRVLPAPIRTPSRNLEGWNRQTAALLADETAMLGDKLGDERRARSFLEYSLLENGLELPNIEQQELRFEELEVETTVAWLKSELQALRLHLKLLQTRFSDQVQEAKAEANLQAKHTEELQTVQTHLEGQLDWTKNSFDLERQLNDQLEEMLADSEIDVEAMVAFLGLTERSGTMSPEVQSSLPDRWADGMPSGSTTGPSEVSMSALSSGSSTPLNLSRWRRGHKPTSGVLAPNSNYDERRTGRKALPNSNPNLNPNPNLTAPAESATPGTGGGSEVGDLGHAVEMRLRSSSGSKDRRAGQVALMDRGASSDVWDQGKAERALQQANWERPHRGGKERLKGGKLDGKGGVQGTSSGGGIMMALFDKKLRKGRASSVPGAGSPMPAGVASIPDFIGRPNDLVEEMIRCLLATYCRHSLAIGNDASSNSDGVQIKTSKSSKVPGFATPNPSNPVTPRLRDSPESIHNLPLPPPYEPTPPPQGSSGGGSGSWWSKSSRSKAQSSKERVMLVERTPPGTPPMTPPHPGYSTNIMHHNDPLPHAPGVSSWAARKGPLPNLQGTRSPTGSSPKVGSRAGALARMQTLSEAELQEARDDVAGWANIPTAAAAAAHFQSRGRSDAAGSGAGSEECSASSSPSSSPPRGAPASGGKGRSSAKKGASRMDVESIREDKEWETLSASQSHGRFLEETSLRDMAAQRAKARSMNMSLLGEIPTEKRSYGSVGIKIDDFVSQLGIPAPSPTGDGDPDTVPNASRTAPSRQRPAPGSGSMDENDPVFMAAARLSRGEISRIGSSGRSSAEASGTTDPFDSRSGGEGGGGREVGGGFDEQGDVEQALRDISLGRSLSARDRLGFDDFGSEQEATADSSFPNSGSQEGGRSSWGVPGLNSSSSSMSEEGFLAEALQTFECRPDALPTKDPYGIGVDHTNLEIGEYAQLLQVTAAPVEEIRSRPETPYMTRFRGLLQQLEEVDPGQLTHEEKLAFWINIYNALLLNAFLTHGIPSTHLKRVSLMSKATFIIGGHTFSALAIEHSVLRACSHRPALTRMLPLQRFPPSDERSSWVLRVPEPLVSFALCPGTRSSPALRIFSAGEIREQLLVAKEDFLRASVGITKTGNSIILPKVLDWYGRDFATSPSSLLEWVVRQLPPAHRSLIEPRINTTNPARCMVVVPYDWTFRYLVDVRGAFDMAAPSV